MLQQVIAPPDAIAGRAPWLRVGAVGLISFLTLVDLFGTQSILPALAKAYGVSPAEMGFAVNASTMGMAGAGLAVALFGRRLPRRRGVFLALALLSLPTALLASAPDLLSFTVLRIAQGVFMATAFALTMAYLAENSGAREAATALAAYVTGNVASNLFGRLASAALADYAGLAGNFYVFALLNVAGAVLAYATLNRASPMADDAGPASAARSAWTAHLRNPALRRAFVIGFLILFGFIGTFTYVNFVLAGPGLGLDMMQLGLVYFVFLPSLLTTPIAGRLALRFGARRTMAGSLALAVASLPLLLVPAVVPVLAGLALVAIGTFLAQATATGFVSRAAEHDRAAASGFYLSSYFCGGLVGSAVLGAAFDDLGWSACVAGIAIALGLAGLLASRLRLPRSVRHAPQ